MSEPATSGNGSTPLLEVKDLVVHHGQLRALDRVSLRVFPGEVYAIIGANGAGKSTLLRTIVGLHQPTDGSITYDGKNMTRVRPERRAVQGIALGFLRREHLHLAEVGRGAVGWHDDGRVLAVAVPEGPV